VQTVQKAPSSARLLGIRAGSAPGALGGTSHNPPVVGSSPTRHLRFAKRTGRTHRAAPQRILAREDVRRDRPLTGREIRFRKTCKSERAAQIELGKLLEQAAAGRQPDSDVTVAELLDRYVSTAGWDVSPG
jgi:hypothetical protein